MPEGMSLLVLVPVLVTTLNPVDNVREELGQERYRVDWTQFDLPPRGLTDPGP